MINRRIAISAMSIMSALLVTGTATFAAFSAQASSNSNVFSTGTMVLTLTDTDETSQGTVVASFGGTALVPGACTGPQTLTVNNTGTVDGSSFGIVAANTDAILAPFLRINSFTFDGTPITVTDNNSNGYMDLADLQAVGASTIGVAHGASRSLVMDVCLDSSAGNAQQGASDSVNLALTLNQ